MNSFTNARKLRLESLEERTLLAVIAGGIETAAELIAPTDATTWIVNTIEDPTEWDTTDDTLSLREAIARAEFGDRITFESYLAGGTIYLNGNQLEVSKGLTIDASDIGGITINANWNSRVFYLRGSSDTNPIRLIGLTITNGLSWEDAAVYAYSDYVEITDCTFSGNIGAMGAICNFASTLTMTNCIVRKNYSGSKGVIHNGVYDSYCLLTMNNCIVTENDGGSGIHNNGGRIVMENCTISCNTINNSVIYNNGGLMKMSNCSISDNTTENGQCGGIYNTSSDLTMTGCTVSGNVTINGACGGIYSDNASLTMIDCSIVGNTGGGIYFNESSDYYALTLTNCTISGNSIGNTGYIGGIYIDDKIDYNSPMSITNCIITYNYGGDINVDFFSRSSNIIGLDPGFVTAPIFDETGILINSEDIDLSLSRDSIAIDRGDNSVVTTETDIVGNLRIINYIVDIGAYEYQETSSISTIIVTTAEDIVDETDNLISLREAVQSANDGDRIVFDNRLSGKTITLNNYDYYDYYYELGYDYYEDGIYITKSITIDASSVGGITIDARQRGRVFYIESSANVEMSGLTITGGHALSGGGVYNNGGILTMIDCIVSGNTSLIYGGGGIYNNCGTLIMFDCLVAENASGDDWNFTCGGGGILSVGNLVLTNCTISGNSGYHGGGICIYDDPDYKITTRMTMTNCTVSGNSSEGIYISSPSEIITQLSIINSVIVGNHGWGIDCNASKDFIYLDYTTITMTNCTIAGNTYGVRLEIYKLNLKNCIICCNRNSDFYDNSQYSDYPYYSQINDNVIGSDPGFKTAPIFDETGKLINFDSLDLSLSEDSIAIDSGDNSVVTTETDIAGNPRIINSFVDIGAYEYQDAPITPSTIIVTTARDTVNDTDNLISLREAIQNANSGDSIIFDSNLAGQTITLNGSELSITKNVTIDASSIGGITINADGKSRVFYIRSGSKANPVVLKELTIIGGFSHEGGGIFNGQNSNLTMIDCIVSENTVDYDSNGGGIYNNGDLRMTNCAVIGNSTGDHDGNGGGIYNNGDLRMMNCTISGNYANCNFGYEYVTYLYNDNGGGGGIYNTGSLIMSDCTITGNTAGGYYGNGGGIYNTGTLKLSDCIITENTAGGYYSNGGGIYNNSPSTSNSLTGCTISDNLASRFGGGIYNYHRSATYRILTLTNCTISRNFSDNDVGLSNGGGGIYNYDAGMLLNGCSVVRNFTSNGNGGGISSRGSVEMTDSRIIGNTAKNGGGGGIYSADNLLTLSNCDISGNSAIAEGSTAGGGICVSGTWAVYLTGCTISGNSASSCSSNSYGGGLSYDGYLCVVNTIITLNYANVGRDTYPVIEPDLSDNYYVFDSNFLTGLDPGFVTAPIFDETGKLINLDSLDLSLSPESQVINIGNNAYVTTETDLAGNPRIYNGIVDLGAYEYQPELPTFSVRLTDWSGSYDGSAHSITVNDPYADTDSIRYSTDGTTYNLTVNPAYTNVGTYTTYVKVSRNGYQDWYGSAIVEISPAEINDLTLTGWTGNFDNTSHAIIVSDPYASTDTVRYSTDGKTYNLTTNPQYTNVGTYTVYVKVSRNGYQDWYGSAVVEILPATITDVTLTGWTGDLNGEGHSITVSDPYASTDTIRYSTDGKTYNLTTNPQYTNVGTYTVYVKVSRNGYQDWYGNAVVEILPSKIEDITLTGWFGRYDGLTHSITVNDPHVSTDTILYSIDGITYNLTKNPQYTNPGAYTTYVKVSRNGYQDWYGSAIVEITPAKINDITLTGWTGNFDNTTHAIIVSDPYASTDTIRYSTDGKTYNLTTNPQYTNVGTYTVYVKVSRNGYQDWYGNAVVEILPSKIEDITLTGWFGRYDGLTHSITVNDPHVSTDTILYSIDGITYNLTKNPQYTNPGAYTTYVKVSRNGYQDWYGSAVVEVGGSVVTTLTDVVDGTDGLISLREAIELYAVKGDVITFASELAGGTIVLAGSEITIDKGITVDASEIGGITIDADGKNNTFYVSGGSRANPVKLISLTITGGKAVNDGGGIYNVSSPLTLINCTISGNSARNGGGIYNRGNLTLTNCTITGNTAGVGGGICNYGTLTLTNCAISKNSSDSYGGGICNYYISTLTNCTISGNISDYNGGGFYNSSRGLKLINCTISGNNASYRGGGIYNSNGSLTLTNSTVTWNIANAGGGIGNFSSCTLNLYNSIIAQNTATLIHGNDIDLKSSSSYSYSIINAYNILSSFTNWTESTDCIVYDASIPLFTDALHGDFTPAENSQAVNKGNNDYVTTEIDFAGNPRIHDGTVDIGAYEYQGIPSPIPTVQLAAPTITTGNKGIFVSFSANRQQITWTAVENTSGYELAYTTDGVNWSSAWVGGTSEAVGDLTYGSNVTYRVRALGECSYIYSEWSATKTFLVCPMDVNGDGDISGLDRSILARSWLTEEGEEDYTPVADIDGNGDISGTDRAFLVANWLGEVRDGDLLYPSERAADIVFAVYESGDLDIDPSIF